MNINDSTYSNLTLRSAQGAQGVSKTDQQAFIKPVVPSVDENNDNKQNENLDQNKSRFDVSEEALAYLEEQRALELLSSGSTITLRDNTSASNNRTSPNNAEYDQPSKHNLSAVAAYETVDNIAERDSIKQFFGVNLFA